MIDTRSGYRFTDEAALKRIKIDGNILPKRRQHQTLRSEDVTYLDECLLERLAVGGGDTLELSWTPVPRIHNGLIRDFITEWATSDGYWHTYNVLGGAFPISEWKLTENSDSYESGDEQFLQAEDELSGQIDNIRHRYREARLHADDAYREAYSAAWREYDAEYGSLTEAKDEKSKELKEAYEEAKEEEESRYEGYEDERHEEYKNEAAALEAEYEELKKDDTLPADERKEKMAENRRQKAIAYDKYRADLLDEKFGHQKKMQELRDRYIEDTGALESQYNDDLKYLEKNRDNAIKKAKDKYDSVVDSFRQQVESVCGEIIANCGSHMSVTTSDAKSLAAEVGVDVRTSDAVEWDNRIAWTKMDDEHSASRHIRRWSDWQIHQGLMFWALYSDYEHARVLRKIYGGVVPDPVLMKLTPGDPAPAAMWDHDYVSSRPGFFLEAYGSYGYYKAEQTEVRIYINIKDRKVAEVVKAGRAFVEVTVHVYGDLGEHRYASRTYKAVIEATIEDPCPNYHAATDAINDAYDAQVKQIEEERDDDIKELADIRDEKLEAEDESLKNDEDDFKKAMDEAVEAAWTEAAKEISRIAAQANAECEELRKDNTLSVAECRKKMAKILNDAVQQIFEARKTRWDKEQAARQEYDDKRTARLSEWSRSTIAIKDEFDEDREERRAEAERMIQDVNDRRAEDLSDKQYEFGERRKSAWRNYYDGLNRVRHERSEALDEIKREDYDTYEEWSDAYDSKVTEFSPILSQEAASHIGELRAVEIPSQYRLCAKFDGSSVFGIASDDRDNVPFEGGGRSMLDTVLLLVPDLRTLTGLSYQFQQFEKYYNRDPEEEVDEDGHEEGGEHYAGEDEDGGGEDDMN